MVEQLRLYSHQQKILDEAPDKHCLWFRQRVGKTPTAIRFMCQRASNVLVITPKSIKNQWIREIYKWRTDNCETIFHVRSKEDVRLNKDMPNNLDGLCWDEVHTAGANYKSQAYKAVDKIIKTQNIKYILLLSGTPHTNGWSAYSYGKLLGRDWKWFDWNKRFFFQIKMGRRLIPKFIEDREPELRQIYHKLGTFIDLKDIAEVMDDIDITEEFSLNSLQKSLIKESWDPLPIVRFTIKSQLEQGVRKSDGYIDAICIECDKDKRLLELVSEQDKVVVVCRYLYQIEKYRKLLLKTDKDIFIISGQIDEQAGDVASKAERSNKAVVLVQGDTCAGYSLASFNTMIFASMSYSFVNFDQMKFRIKSMDKKTPCEYIYLLTEKDSIDRAVFDAVSKKQNFSFELYDK